MIRVSEKEREYIQDNVEKVADVIYTWDITHDMIERLRDYNNEKEIQEENEDDEFFSIDEEWLIEEFDDKIRASEINP